MSQFAQFQRRRRQGPGAGVGVWVFLVLLLATPAPALHVIDFEQPYYVHDGWQVWDFCLVKNNGLYFIFYGAIPMSGSGPFDSDDIWRSSSSDLIHWTPPAQVLSVSGATYEAEALWAPDVVRDEASGLWWLCYTGVDVLRNQRLCIAYSTGLTSWSKSPYNPIVEPSPPDFLYYPDGGWSECRDPYLYRDGDSWKVLSTVQVDADPDAVAGLAVTTATNVHIWDDPGVFMVSGSANPTASLESPQYLQRDGVHHLFFHEYGTIGISHLAAEDPAEWNFSHRTVVDLGFAPEVDTFDGGASYLVSRVGPYEEPHLDQLAYVVRMDTLSFYSSLQAPVVQRTPPLAREFDVFTGNITLGNPTFGDNPRRRGEDAVNLVGYSYFGSSEYFQGPLSGRGQPGQQLGLTATGSLTSKPFTITGNSISLLVGGTDNIETCYVALVDAEADTVVHRSTGHGVGAMTERWWDTSRVHGREVYVRIVDSDTEGHINVDHIAETMIALGVDGRSGPTPRPAIRDLGPRPNPGNPQVHLRFEVDEPTVCTAAVYDLRGRLVWRGAPRPVAAGRADMLWSGRQQSGRRASGGVYVYRVTTAAGEAISGKVTLAP